MGNTILLSLELPDLDAYHALKSDPRQPEGVSVWMAPQGAGHGGPLIDVWAVVEFGLNVSGSLVAAWLYDHFRKRKQTKLRIQRKEIILDQGVIQKVIEEEIRVSHK
jgi:hypothetical protein